MSAKFWFSFAIFCWFALVNGGSGSSSLYDFVTCGSVLKLLNVGHNLRLHSHEVRYGSGSGQQSVTAVEASGDKNSYWRVNARTGAAVCRRGAPVKCGSTVRLAHVTTGRNLHSHLYSSPITNQQEVSAYGEAGEGDHGDDWRIVCDGASGLWRRGEQVRIRHALTEQYLHVSGHRFGRPIAGQAEVSAVRDADDRGSYWLAAEGIFIKPSESAGADQVPTVGRPDIVHGGAGVHDSGEL